MLVLQRRTGEKLIIEMLDGRHIEITLTKSRDDRAWLGVTAPKEIRVWREEVKAAIDKRAANSVA